MVWAKGSRRSPAGRERGDQLSDALDGAHNLPADLGQTARRAMANGRAGSIGGAPIWVMREAFVPSRCTCREVGRAQCVRHGGSAAFDGLMGRARTHDGRGDPDGYAVFGRFPKGWLDQVFRDRLLGDVRRDDVLHVCSGTLTEGIRVDLRRAAQPTVLANGCALPFRDASFPAVLLDPPYSDQYAKNLYGSENPRPSWLLREAARVVQPCGRVGMLHVAVPFAPPGCKLLAVYGVTTGVGFRIRALTIYERWQDELPLGDAVQLIEKAER